MQGPARILGEERGDREKIWNDCAEFARIHARTEVNLESIEFTGDTKKVRQKLGGLLGGFGVNFSPLQPTSNLHLNNGEMQRGNGP